MAATMEQNYCLVRRETLGDFKADCSQHLSIMTAPVLIESIIQMISWYMKVWELRALTQTFKVDGIPLREKNRINFYNF